MPSGPSRNQLHTDVPLTNLVIGYLQDPADFSYLEVAPILNVDKSSGSYYAFDPGSWNRLAVRPRGKSEETTKAGWEMSKQAYQISRQSVGHSRDWGDDGNIDKPVEGNIDAKIATFLAHQARLYGETLLGDLFASGVWGEDWAGAAAKDYSNDKVLYWDNASANPRKDIMHLASLIKKKSGGAKPNTLFVGDKVHEALAAGDLLVDLFSQSTAATAGSMEKFVRDYFGVENYRVGGAIINSAKQGDTDDMGFVIDENSVWLGVVDKKASSEDSEVYTAMRTLAFKNAGRNKNGINIQRYVDQPRTSKTADMDIWQTIEVTAADAGAFISDVLTP